MMKLRSLLRVSLMACLVTGLFPASVCAESEPAEVIQEPSVLMDTVSAPAGMWVESAETNGIPARIDVFKKQSGSNWNPTYTYQLYLPGNVNVDNIMLSWDGGSQVTYDNVTYSSGSCPIPPIGTAKTFIFKNGTQALTTWNFVAYQGGADVQPVFIDIDESQGTIAAMDGDSDHETECVGRINIGSTWYDMPKIKGRGNATWSSSKDKKPYNVTLGSKINFPGIESEKTKKWSFLAEITDHSLLCNRTGLYLANEIGVGQDTTSADVWMNGEYQGTYTITPKTDSFVSKDGFMIEQDNYLEKSVAEGGDPQFKLDGMVESSGWSSAYNRITVKKIGDNLLKNSDGVVDESVENIEAIAADIQSWLQDAWDAIRSDTGFNSKGKYYTEYIDMESFAKMYLLHEYIKSYDVCAGSILFHRDGMGETDKLFAGPLWDVDNALGSTCQNGSLGKADDRRNGDRRSAQGAFISNVTEYKTSIYKTISKHEDFMKEVYKQYNKYRSAFNDLSLFVDQKKNEIQASATMNHYKVNDLTGTYVNVHKYSSATTLGSGNYRQSYLATTNSQTDWANYVANLNTYVTTRSLWFDNTYYDPNLVPCEHTNLINPVWTWSDDCSAATVAFECADCGETVTFDGTIVDSVLNDDDTVTFTAEYVLNDVPYTDTKTANAIIANFIKDEGVERVDVYYTQDYSQPSETDADKAVVRDSSTGKPIIDGSGQLNFQIVLKDGYLFSSLTATEGTFKNIKGTEDTGVPLLYRITKVTGSMDITIETVKCSHENVSNPVWTWSEDYSSAELSLDCADCGQTITLPGTVSSALDEDGKTIIFTATAELNGTAYTDTQTAMAFIASFETDDHTKINVYYTDDATAADETDVIQAVVRNGVTGNPIIDGNGHVNFEVAVDEGYEITDISIEGSYQNLNMPEDTGKENTYRVTGVESNLEIKISTRKTPIFINSASVALEEKIQARIYVYVPDSELDTTYITTTFNGVTKTEYAKTMDTAVRSGRECRLVTVDTFAKQMRDDILVKVHKEDETPKYLEYKGTDVTDGFTFHVADYVTLAEENSDDELLIDLVHKMNWYGLYAQQQFNYKPVTFEEPAVITNFNDGVLADYAVQNTGTANGIEYKSGSLQLDSDTGIKVNYVLTGTDAIEDYTFAVNGEETTPVLKNGKYTVSITGIAAKELNKVYEITVTDKDGNTLTTKYSGLTYTHSVVSNANAPETLKDLCRSIYLYWEAAYKYFGGTPQSR